MNKIVYIVTKPRTAPCTFQNRRFSAIARQEATFSANTGRVLDDVAKQENMLSPKISCYGQVGKGLGVSGDLFFVNIHDPDNKKLIELLVKQATTVKKVRDYFPVNWLYRNESNFYNNIWPEFLSIQYSHHGSLFFDNVPKCYGSDVQPKDECVILENLKSDNYTNIDKKQYMNKELFGIILKKYGQFHALSYMFKTSDPKSFLKTSKKQFPYWEGAKHIVPLRVSIDDVFQKSLNYLTKSGDHKLINKMQQFKENGLELFSKSNQYQGDHGVFLHGDSWSNNLMFKFDNSGKVQDLKLIDFQTCKVGSPVCDVSYCIYSGGSQEIFDDLDYYINLYYHSLAETCTKLGCKKFISLDEFKQEWNEYCKFGWIMAMVIFRAKLVRDDAKLDLLLMLNELEKRGSKAHLEDSDEEEVEKRTLVLIDHLNKNGYL